MNKRMGEGMRFYVVSRGDETSNQLQEQMINDLQQFKWQYSREAPDLVISVGGDGTLLDAFHQYVHRLDSTAFLGVHTGRLGFFADWQPHEMEKLVTLIATSPIQTVDYPLLEVVIKHAHKEEQRCLALNECTLKRSGGSVVMDIEINNEPFETFRGDGLCISTPSGSTAYNKSLGGAIVHPSLSAIQLTEMASINNRVFRTIGSPLIFPDHHTCTLIPMNDGHYQISVDHLSFAESSIKQLSFHVAQEKVRFARYRSFPFWKRVKESFIED